jgi:hypothetical protein
MGDAVTHVASMMKYTKTMKLLHVERDQYWLDGSVLFSGFKNKALKICI